MAIMMKAMIHMIKCARRIVAAEFRRRLVQSVLRIGPVEARGLLLLTGVVENADSGSWCAGRRPLNLSSARSESFVLVGKGTITARLGRGTIKARCGTPVTRG